VGILEARDRPGGRRGSTRLREQETEIMASTHINHLKHYLERVDRFPDRPNVLTVGDSWFQYPLRLYPDLETRLSQDAVFGRRVNFLDDSAPGRDARDVKKMIKSWDHAAGLLQGRGRPFSLFLLSLGGNDVIGRDFSDHLTDGTGRSDAPWPWSSDVPEPVRRWLNLGQLAATFAVVAESYRKIIALRDQRAPQATIITHTYADVTPMDAKYKFAFIKSGPWIRRYTGPAGVSKDDEKLLVRWLLANFHRLLLAVAAETHRFIVLDTRLELPDKAEWDNEIHPLGPGFVHLADHFWVPAIEPLL
jgi:hypothetical protein